MAKDTKKKPNFFSSVSSALDDVIGEIKADVKSMTPPDEQNLAHARKLRELEQERARLAELLTQSSSGLAENTVGDYLPEEPEEEFEQETRGGPIRVKPNLSLPVGNLWQALKDPASTQRLHGDVCYHAHTVADIKLYVDAVIMQRQAPFTLGIIAINLSARTAEEVADENAERDLISLAIVEAVKSEPRLFGAVGAGPRALWDDQNLLDDQLCQWLNDNPKLIALGPIGLDEPFAPYTLNLQQQQFARQLDIAADFDLPAFITCRNSHTHMAETLTAQKSLPRLVYLDPVLTQADADLVTRFKMSVVLRPELTAPTQPMADFYRKLPQSNLLLGCGSALVAPHGFSGHFNEPKFLQNTLEATARMLNLKVPDLLAITNANLSNLFPEASRN